MCGASSDCKPRGRPRRPPRPRTPRKPPGRRGSSHAGPSRRRRPSRSPSSRLFPRVGPRRTDRRVVRGCGRPARCTGRVRRRQEPVGEEQREERPPARDPARADQDEQAGAEGVDQAQESLHRHEPIGDLAGAEGGQEGGDGEGGEDRPRARPSIWRSWRWTASNGHQAPCTAYTPAIIPESRVRTLPRVAMLAPASPSRVPSRLWSVRPLPPTGRSAPISAILPG